MNPCAQPGTHSYVALISVCPGLAHMPGRSDQSHVSELNEDILAPAASVLILHEPGVHRLGGHGNEHEALFS